MGVFDIGNVCVKTMGREAGQRCVIVEVIDNNYALIDGPNVRRRRCNFNHLVPTKDKIDIKKGDSLKSIESAIKKAKLTDEFEKKIVPKLQL
ncbi:MAG: 50S ribosomal protein L14e [Candidatus Lokiarchaeota archaeon]|nr:50S ribosomal protein L14e [Candidatus Lokiarchaeota archaeon]